MKIAVAAAIAALTASGALAAPVNWVDWTSATSNSASGTISIDGGSVGVTMTNSANNAFVTTGGGTNYWTNPATYTSSNCTAGATCADNAPPASDIIALNGGGAVTLSFSETLQDVYFGFVSWNGNTAVYSTPVKILSYGRGFFGDGTPSQFDANTITHSGETHGTLLLAGALDGFSFTHLSENWHGFTIGVADKAGVAPVPLPAAGWLLLGGLASLAGLRGRRALG